MGEGPEKRLSSAAMRVVSENSNELPRYHLPNVYCTGGLRSQLLRVIELRIQPQGMVM